MKPFIDFTPDQVVMKLATQEEKAKLSSYLSSMAYHCGIVHGLAKKPNKSGLDQFSHDSALRNYNANKVAYIELANAILERGNKEYGVKMKAHWRSSLPDPEGEELYNHLLKEVAQ